MHEFSGVCPVCKTQTRFVSEVDWYRDNLLCQACGSIPRERAFTMVLERYCPDWRSLVVHESSPADRLVSNRMQKECPGYIGTQYFPDLPAGDMRDGFRCENLEKLSFGDETIDVHVHLDVLEHVNHPGDCFAEMERTLRPGGQMIFTTPIYEDKLATERRGYYDAENTAHFLFEPEYHGNPIDETGAPVTFHYGQDFSDLILAWTQACDVMILVPAMRSAGILGKFREVCVVTKPA